MTKRQSLLYPAETLYIIFHLNCSVGSFFAETRNPKPEIESESERERVENHAGRRDGDRLCDGESLWSPLLGAPARRHLLLSVAFLVSRHRPQRPQAAIRHRYSHPLALRFHFNLHFVDPLRFSLLCNCISISISISSISSISISISLALR